MPEPDVPMVDLIVRVRYPRPQPALSRYADALATIEETMEDALEDFRRDPSVLADLIDSDTSTVSYEWDADTLDHSAEYPGDDGDKFALPPFPSGRAPAPFDYGEHEGDRVYGTRELKS